MIMVANRRVLVIITLASLADLILVSVFYLIKINALRESLELMRRQVISLQDQRNAVISEKVVSDEQISLLEQSNQRLEDKVTELEADITNFSSIEGQLIPLSRERDALQQDVTSLADDKIKFANQLSNLEAEKSSLNSQLITMSAEKDNLVQRLNSVIQSLPHYIRLITPNGGEALCFGDRVAIEWESKGLDNIVLNIFRQWSDRKLIGVYPATFNTTESGKGKIFWEVGETAEGVLGAGNAYTLGVSSNDDGVDIYDNSNAVFAITECE